VIAFAAIQSAVSRGFHQDPAEEPARVRALGSSISFFSVGSSLVVALVAGQLEGGFATWPLGAFLATVVYLLVFALEIAVAERLRGNRSR
jgi:membrane protein YdbS with pleckstrin-like domain